MGGSAIVGTGPDPGFLSGEAWLAKTEATDPRRALAQALQSDAVPLQTAHLVELMREAAPAIKIHEVPVSVAGLIMQDPMWVSEILNSQHEWLIAFFEQWSKAMQEIAEANETADEKRRLRVYFEKMVDIARQGIEIDAETYLTLRHTAGLPARVDIHEESKQLSWPDGPESSDEIVSVGEQPAATAGALGEQPKGGVWTGAKR